MIFLENEYLTASFSSIGAELQSLINKKNKTNYLWNGDPAYWAKHSPILFPIVGGLKKNTYYYDDHPYQLPRHGFARDHIFQTFRLSDTEVLFELSQNEETLKNYPFEFTLKLRYRIEGSTLSCTYEVTNPSPHTPLLFSIGAHPAFTVPLSNDLLYTDYYLEFNNDDTLAFYKVIDDLITNETTEVELEARKLPLIHELFYNDALVFKSLKSDCISIRTTKNPHGLHFKFKDFPFFGIWAAKNANFVCLEPWCGIADSTDHQQDLQKKEGIVKLPALENWSKCWEVMCF